MSTINAVTQDEVIARLKALSDEYKYYADLADKIGCTKAQLTLALQKKVPPCPAILKALGVQRVEIFVDKFDPKFKIKKGKR